MFLFNFYNVKKLGGFKFSLYCLLFTYLFVNRFSESFTKNSSGACLDSTPHDSKDPLSCVDSSKKIQCGLIKQQFRDRLVASKRPAPITFKPQLHLGQIFIPICTICSLPEN